MNDSISGDLSRQLAHWVGETEGRTASSRLADGVSHLTDGAISPDLAKDVVHAAMGAGVAVALIPGAPRSQILLGGVFLAFVAWQAGKKMR
jgi:hypothetical protein